MGVGVQIPDMAGQPWWVVVVVAVLTVLGSVGGAWVTRRANKDELDTEEPTALSAGDEGGEAYQAIQLAIQALADVATREADESNAERVRADELRKQLQECARALQLAEAARDTAERKLSECEQNARILINRLQEGQAG